MAVACVLEYDPVLHVCREDSCQGEHRVERDEHGHVVSGTNTRRVGGGPDVSTLDAREEGEHSPGHHDCGGGRDGAHPLPHHWRSGLTSHLQLVPLSTTKLRASG